MEVVWDFLNSNLFIAFVTFGAALVAYFLYRKRIKDDKKDAANILLLEIQNAERQIKVAREQMIKNNVLVDDAYVMPTMSWGQYKYLFVRDFDRDEWDTVNSFYEKCGSFDESVRHKSTAFSNNEAAIRANLHRVTADYVQNFTHENIETDKEEKGDVRSRLQKEIDVFQDEYLGLPESLTLYTPNKPINDAKKVLETIQENLSQTSVGAKLKKITRLK